MNPELSKQKQKSDAAARAAAAAPSQVNEVAPSLYQAPQINVPGSLHEVAVLIRAELLKIEQAQSALLSLANASNDGLRYVDGTVVFRAPKDRPYPLQIEQSDTTQANYIRLYKGQILQGGMGNADASNDVSIWSNLGGNSITARANGAVAIGAARRYYFDGSFNTQLSFPGGNGDPHVALVDYALRDGEGGGIAFGAHMNNAPADTTIFAYGSTQANGIGEGVLTSHSALGGGYQHHMLALYGANKFYQRTRNGDSGNWNTWTANHFHAGGSTSYADWNGIGFHTRQGDAGSIGHMEIRQYDDGNGVGANSPGGGYGTALFFGEGLFNTQVVFNDNTGSISVRTAYAGTSKGWSRHEPTVITKRQIYAELLEARVITAEAHAALNRAAMRTAAEPEPAKPRPELLPEQPTQNI
ncbi:hypothetical protein [Buttiauxella sp.]|uniref:hypothetical protein n=1 Tax=Buttiauxella sp. TaxID=1972222 RepID=UPI003C720333